MKDDFDAALYAQYGDDPELAFALKMSMMEEAAKQLTVPDEPPVGEPGSVNLQLRLPDGSRVQRRFLVTHKISDIMNFVKKEGKGASTSSQVRLSTTFPKKYFDEPDKTLGECGLTKSETLIVELK
jgi:UBX domain